MYTGERDERADYTLYSNFHLHCVAKLQCLKGCFGMRASMGLKGLLHVRETATVELNTIIIGEEALKHQKRL